MTDGSLQLLYFELFKACFPLKRYQLKASFYKTKALRHSIEFKAGVIRIGVAEAFRNVPERILKILALILFAKLFGHKIDPHLRQEYHNYIQASLLPQSESRLRRPSAQYQAQGRFYNLENIFDKINQEFFELGLKKPILGWSLHKSYTRLGFFCRDKNLLVISKIFDSKRVPPAVVDYMMYHEMLHILVPAQDHQGRRRIHPRQFRELDRKFPNHRQVKEWIKKNRCHL